jgi:hypothetical protein
MLALPGDARIAICDGEVEEAHASDREPAVAPEADLHREFIDHVAGHFHGDNFGGGDPDVLDVLEVETATFAEMYLASLEGDATDDVDSLGIVGDGGDAIGLDPGEPLDGPIVVDSLMAELGDGGDEMTDAVAKSASSSGPSGTHGASSSSGAHDAAPTIPEEVGLTSTASSSSGSGPAIGGPSPPSSDPHGDVDKIDFDSIAEGGFVRRNGENIGKVTPWANGKNLGVRCMMHRKCSHVVPSRTTMEECARWLAAGEAVPHLCTEAVNNQSRDRHMKQRRPVPPPLPKSK